MKLPYRFVARSIAFTFFMAVLGFSYAIVTQADHSAVSPRATPRALGTQTKRFLNAAYTPTPTEFDLGDALFGTVITRYVTATGGLRPYAFSSPDLLTVLGANSTMTVKPSGRVFGLATATSPINTTFSVAVTDGTETSTTLPAPVATSSTFHLQLFATGANLFRFAVDHLNNGVLGQSYISKVDTIGGKNTVTYTIVPGTVAVNGVLVGTGNSLQDAVGLSMSADGTVFGRPLRTGLVSFRAHAVDSRKRIANDRTNSSPDQFLSFNIEDSRVTSTDATFLALSVKGDTSKTNGDTISFRAFMNLSGRNTTTLAGQRFAFLIGGSTFEGFLDQFGAVHNILGQPLIFPDGTLMSATIDSVNGVISGKITRATLTTSLDATTLVNRSTRRYGVALIIDGQILATDTIELNVKRVANRYALDYSIGKIGQTLGGNFQIYDVRGSDGLDIAGNPADNWISKFLIAPRYGIEDSAGYDNISDITVRIGTTFSQQILASELKLTNGGTLQLAQKGFGQSLLSFSITPQTFSGQLMSNQIATDVTGIPKAVDTNTPNNNFFNLAVDVNRNPGSATFNGEDARFMFKVPVFSKWIDRNSKKPKP